MDFGETSEQSKLNEIYYNCTECPSLIVILSIDERYNTIEFQCLNGHKRKIEINEYINKMKEYNNKDINNDICLTYKKKYEYYCRDCNIHLCKDCLLLRNHINHFKNIIIEIQPNKKELNIIENKIKSFEDKIGYLEKEKLKRTNKFKKIINKLNERKDLKLKDIKDKFEKGLKLNKEKYLNDINNIIKRLLKNINEIKKRKYDYIKNQIQIENKYKLLIENNNMNI